MELFSALLAICAENSLVTGEFPAQRPVTRTFDFEHREASGLGRHPAHYDVIVMVPRYTIRVASLWVMQWLNSAGQQCDCSTWGFIVVF